MSDEATEMAKVFRLRVDAVGLGPALMEFAESIAEVTFMRGTEKAVALAREEGRRTALADAVKAIKALDEEECAGVRGITGECYAHAVRSLASPRGDGTDADAPGGETPETGDHEPTKET